MKLELSLGRLAIWNFVRWTNLLKLSLNFDYMNENIEIALTNALENNRLDNLKCKSENEVECN